LEQEVASVGGFFFLGERSDGEKKHKEKGYGDSVHRKLSGRSGGGFGGCPAIKLPCEAFERREGVAGIGLIGIALGLRGVLYARWLDSLRDTRAGAPAPHERHGCYTF
jgi:hypothetical protein